MSCDNANRALTGYNREQLLCTFICIPDKEWFIYMQVQLIFKVYSLQCNKNNAKTKIFFKVKLQILKFYLYQVRIFNSQQQNINI